MLGRLAAGVAVAPGAVLGRRAELARLERAARLVVGLARAPARRPRGPAPAAGRDARAPRPCARRRARHSSKSSSSRKPGSSAQTKRPRARDEPADRLGAQRLGERGLARAGRWPRSPGREHERADPRRRARTARGGGRAPGPRARRATTAVRTSPARRRSVVSATRRRSSSSATTVTAWWRMQAVDLGQAAGVLDGHEPRLPGTPPRSGASPAPTGSARPRGARSGWLGTKLLPSPRRARSRSSCAERLDDLVAELAAERAHRLALAAAVEDERGAADERRQRADDRVEAALGQDDPLQALLRGDRALQQRVLLVDEPRERLLGERDERQLVGHLEQREAALARGLQQRRGHRVVLEAGAEPDAREPVVGQRRDEVALGGRAVERHARRQQELAARQPGGRVGELGDVHPAHRHVEVRPRRRAARTSRSPSTSRTVSMAPLVSS